jgi:ferredoxin-thioredoxin reductase catalytic chain
MNNNDESAGKPQPPIPEQIDELYQRLNREAEESGYHLNPDLGFTRALVESLLINQDRFGYQACPCRLAEGVKQEDLDIICPCDYRDADVDQYGSCYCALYVSAEIAEGKGKPEPIPERRPERDKRSQHSASADPGETLTGLAKPMWRCTVCGYLCARDQPPGVCPICKAKKDRFVRFM